MQLTEVFQDWIVSLVQFLPKLIAGVIIFVLSLFLANLAAKWIKKVAKKKIDSVEILQLISTVTRWTVIILGTIFALSQVDFDVTGFVAGLGVAGLTVGFALQDIAKNFVSGLLLLIRQPFQLGEFIEVADFSGTVKEINIRDTVIETLDGELVIIPNTQVFENPIINNTHSTLRRATVSIGLGYDENTDKAMEIFLETIKSIPGVAVDPKPSILADTLGDSALMLTARFWINQKKDSYIEVQSEVVKAIKVASETHGINLPYPVQTVLLKQVSE
jgi:small conductance mechanosensitive channel